MPTKQDFPDSYSLANLADHVGRRFGPSDPVLVDQARIQGFADVTGDQQWIHVDVERAKAQSPFGGPIAHGFLTLSLLASAQMDLGIVPEDAKGVMNYGLDKVRFLAPVPSGSEVQISAELTGVEAKKGGRILIRATVTAQVLGSEEPALIAETLAMAFA